MDRAADSDDEVRLLHALHRHGMDAFVRQPPVRLLDGGVVHPDLGDPVARFYIEVDHHTWHSSAASVAYDTARDRKVRLTGAAVERVTDDAIATDLAEVVNELAALYRLWRRSIGAESARIGRLNAKARPAIGGPAGRVASGAGAAGGRG